MARIAIIADDLTGAADAAVAFANQGHSSRVLLDPSYNADVDIIAVTTESRHLPPALSAERVRELTHHLYGTPILYKKIDSTLRGNIAHELLALMEGFEESRALVAPAFPAQGRTTVYGRQMIDGWPLEETDFGSQIATSSLREIFLRARGARPVRLITLADVRQGTDRLVDLLINRPASIHVADAETDDDMSGIAEAALASNLRLLCGSAGLCHALARIMPPNGTPEELKRSCEARPILTIAGSLHTATINQIDAARRAGIPVIEPVNLVTRAIGPLIDRGVELLNSGQNVVLATHQVDDSAPSDLTIADRLARIADRILKRAEIGGLVLTGGDVASAVCRHLGSRAIDLLGEVQPGIPYGVLRGGGADELPVVTKAGGFGANDAIVDAIGFLSES